MLRMCIYYHNTIGSICLTGSLVHNYSIVALLLGINCSPEVNFYNSFGRPFTGQVSFLLPSRQDYV